MRVRTSKVSGVLVAALSMAAACGGESSKGSSEACGDPACCAPVEFEPTRSRAYLVGDHLELYLATRGKAYAPDQSASVWADEGQVDVEVSAPGIEATICDGRTESSAAGLNGQHCSAPRTSDIACGQELTFELAFRSTHRPPDSDESLCAAATFTTRAVWKIVVACAACVPGSPAAGTCDHPPSLECAAGTANPFCSPLGPGCRCRFDVFTGERKWQCPPC
jgi:hypothetical protein